MKEIIVSQTPNTKAVKVESPSPKIVEIINRVVKDKKERRKEILSHSFDFIQI